VKVRILKYLIPERIPWFAAELYDKVARMAIASYYHKVAEEIIAEINCGNILDIGTGSGYLPIEIVKIAPNIKVAGIDLTPKLIQIARSNAAEASISNQVKFEVSNANRLKFEDNSFDMVISTGSFHSWKKPVRVIDECYRVLKPGAQAWIYDPADIATEEIAGLWRKRKLKRRDRFAYRWASLTHRIMARACTVDEIHQIVSKTKFKDYEVEQGEWIRIKLRK
jgi:ubiquinone/menaquinone biosynthesis C-methylase UbiE